MVVYAQTTSAVISEREREREREGKLVVYAQTTSAVISERERDAVISTAGPLICPDRTFPFPELQS